MLSSITLHLIPMRQVLSLNLELGCQTEGTGDPPASTSHSAGVTEEYDLARIFKWVLGI